MQPVRDILVRVEDGYKASIKTKGGVEIFLDQNLCQVKDTNRFGEVVAVPHGLNDDIQIGDTLFFHHSIVAITRMDSQPDIESPYLVDREKKIYRVPVNPQWPMAYAIVRNGVFSCLDGSCFVRPITRKKVETFLFIPGNEEIIPHLGELVHGNKALEDMGVSEGDEVVFAKDSEYEFEIGGEILYRMFNRWILGKYETEK